jgi:hypothetical protein
VGGVLDQSDAGVVADLPQRIQVGRVAAVVHGADRLGARRDLARDLLGVDAEVVVALDVGEDGLGAAVARGCRGRHERDRRNDHLVPGAHAGGQIGEVQRGGAVGQRDRVLGA